ncbi:MAG: transmembrane 220 family protein [Spirochaetales bacterium]|nr:transmembrane 220 family protein [Leptospiraceae bacterium]MCP5482937.1 transmembrane 220 family protein [Spirochaetales bacterium]MCP5484883.1 transmembrane 220 family protein [Spirochaetales bacterium]
MQTQSLALHAFRILMALLFVLSALVQYNDPDPLSWIAAYLAPVLLTGLLYRGWNVRFPAIGLAVVAVIWAALIFRGVPAANPLGDEVLRECGGLLILAFYAAHIAASQSRNSNHAPID